MQKILITILTLLFIVTMSGCEDKQEKAPEQKRKIKTIRIVGSTSMLPVSERLARKYESMHPGVKIYVQGGDSSLGIRGVSNDIAEIGSLSRPLTAAEKEKYQQFVLTDEKISIIVNPFLGLNNLTLENLRGIFSGKIDNWQDVGGPDHTITLITREQGSGTHNVFVDTVMGDGNRIADSALVMASTGAVRTAVAKDKYAIGYISSQYLSEGVRPVPVAQGDDKSIILNRPLIYITKKPVDQTTGEFINFSLSDEGKALYKERH